MLGEVVVQTSLQQQSLNFNIGVTQDIRAAAGFGRGFVDTHRYAPISVSRAKVCLERNGCVSCWMLWPLIETRAKSLRARREFAIADAADHESAAVFVRCSSIRAISVGRSRAEKCPVSGTVIVSTSLRSKRATSSRSAGRDQSRSL